MKYLVVGSGLFGATFAHEMAGHGHQVHVIEKLDHVAGHIYTKEVEGIQVHEYGAHIFHTSNEKIWNYINQFAEFNNYINSPIAISKGKLYSLPFNMNTFYQMWGIKDPEKAYQKIQQQRQILNGKKPENLEEQAISLVGTDIYETLIKEYTEKQWGRSTKELPPFIIKRLPVRYTFDNNYFNDRYQGIPIGGYTQIINKMLEVPGITVEINTDFYDKRDEYMRDYDKIVFTGMIDQFFGYKLGTLDYRGLEFETKILNKDNYQGNAVVNYIDKDIPYTRIIEHKHFEFGKGNKGKTIITKEYPKEWHQGEEPYYPVNDLKNNKLYKEYKKLAEDTLPNVIFGGRLGQYRYYDMDKVIGAAFQLINKELQ